MSETKVGEKERMLRRSGQKLTSRTCGVKGNEEGEEDSSFTSSPSVETSTISSEGVATSKEDEEDEEGRGREKMRSTP